MLLLINNPNLWLILFYDPVKIPFFLLADEVIANGFIVFSCCGRRVKQKETPSVALFSLKELAELSSQLLPSQKKSTLTSRGKEHLIKMSLIIKQIFSTVSSSAPVEWCTTLSQQTCRGLSVKRCIFCWVFHNQRSVTYLPKLSLGAQLSYLRWARQAADTFQLWRHCCSVYADKAWNVKAGLLPLFSSNRLLEKPISLLRG